MAAFAPALPAVPPAVRTCASRAESGLFVHGIPRFYRSRIVRAGPLVFIAREYATQPASLFRAVAGRPGRYYPQKLLVLVRAGSSVTVGVPARQRRFALLYGRSHWDIPYARGYRLADGERRVTFHACTASTPSFVRPKRRRVGRWTEFNGSVIVAGARCVTLDVRSGRRRWQTSLSFGVAGC